VIGGEALARFLVNDVAKVAISVAEDAALTRLPGLFGKQRFGETRKIVARTPWLVFCRKSSVL